MCPPDNVTAIHSLGWTTLILRTDNTLWTFGENYWGKYKNDSEQYLETPTKLLDNIISADVGQWHSIIIKDDNSVWGMGYNYDGQLGILSSESQSTFTEISFYE